MGMGCCHSNIGKLSATVSPREWNFNSKEFTFDNVSKWSANFEMLMKFPSGQKMFAEFLKREFSDENILFWQACEELKKEKNSEKMEEKARIIYEDFISILSPKEVSLDSKVREAVNKNMTRPSKDTFDEAQGQIYVLMARDSYPRFLISDMYKRVLDSFGVREVPIDEEPRGENEQNSPRD